MRRSPAKRCIAATADSMGVSLPESPPPESTAGLFAQFLLECPTVSSGFAPPLQRPPLASGLASGAGRIRPREARHGSVRPLSYLTPLN
jgi:hypothetical protein